MDTAARGAELERNDVADDFDRYAAGAAVALRRALVATYGVELGVDAAADAMAWAWAHRDRLAAMSNPTGYLYRVGQTSVRRQARHQRRRSLLDLPAEPAAPESAPLDGGLHEALAAVTPAQRAAVLLVHAHGYPYAEAADLLGIPVSALKNHLHRGLARLRAHLEGHR